MKVGMNVKLGIAGLVVLALCGCGSSTNATNTTKTTEAPTTSSSSSSSATTYTNTTAPSPNLLAAWCQLKIGESRADVLAAMGQPNGHKADAYKVSGIDSAEWDVDVTILLASFENGVATNLQAYDNTIGPQGSTHVGCAPFRNTGKPNG
jgi:hypothetical protein